MVEDQPVLAKVMDVMGLTIAVIGLFFSFVGDGEFAKHRLAPIFEGLLVFVLQLSVKVIESFGDLFEHHQIITG